MITALLLLLVQEDPGALIREAEKLRNRGREHLEASIRTYQKALKAIPEDHRDRIHLTAECRFGIGWCHHELGQFEKAVTSLGHFESGDLKNNDRAADAAKLKLACLQRIRIRTGTDKAKRAIEEFRDWMVRQPHLLKRFEPQFLRNQAVELEQEGAEARLKHDYREASRKYGAAAVHWQRLAEKEGDHEEEALYNAGFDRYREGLALNLYLADDGVPRKQKAKLEEQVRVAYQSGLVALGIHLAMVESKDFQRTDSSTLRALGSVLLSMRILNDPLIDRPKKALAVSNHLAKRFPQADPAQYMPIHRRRLEILANRQDMRAAMKEYGFLGRLCRKTGKGRDHQIRALEVLIEALKIEAGRVRREDPGLAEEWNARRSLYEMQLKALQED